jgi:hypothetical protein
MIDRKDLIARIIACAYKVDKHSVMQIKELRRIIDEADNDRAFVEVDYWHWHITYMERFILVVNLHNWANNPELVEFAKACNPASGGGLGHNTRDEVCFYLDDSTLERHHQDEILWKKVEDGEPVTLT